MCVWQETVRGCVLPRSVDVRPRSGALFTESSFIPHLGWPWLQAKEPVGPTASGVAAAGSGTHGVWRGPWLSGGACGCSGAGARQWGPWRPVWPETAGRPAPPARQPRPLCPQRSLQRSLNCAFRSALPDCSVPRGGGSADACDKCLLTDSPSRLATSAAGTGCCPPAGPGRPSS